MIYSSWLKCPCNKYWGTIQKVAISNKIYKKPVSYLELPPFTERALIQINFFFKFQIYTKVFFLNVSTYKLTLAFPRVFGAELMQYIAGHFQVVPGDAQRSHHDVLRVPLADQPSDVIQVYIFVRNVVVVLATVLVVSQRVDLLCCRVRIIIGN